MSVYTDSLLLSELFLENIKNFQKVDGVFEVSMEYKRVIILNARNIIKNNNDLDFIFHSLKSNYLNFNSKDIEISYNISSYLRDFEKFNVIDDEPILKAEELIQFGKFYYHPLLQLSVQPPRFELTPAMDLVEIPTEEFFLENVESFTLTDLTKYFILKSKHSDISLDSMKRQFLKVLERYHLDLVLYMIDFSTRYAEDQGIPAPRNPLYLSDSIHVAGARSIYYDRVTSSKEKGINHEIAKKKFK